MTGVLEPPRVRAARNGRSMEAAIRAILTEAVSDRGPERGLFTALLGRFASIGGVELELPRAVRPRAAGLNGGSASTPTWCRSR